MELEDRKKIERDIYNKKQILLNRPKWGDQWDGDIMNYIMKEQENLIKNWAKIYLENKKLLILGGGIDEARVIDGLHLKSLTVINISEKEIEESKPYYPKYAKLLIEDAEKTRFRDGSFDAILCKSILHHLDIDNSLAEIYRILIPSGTIFISKEPLLLNPIAYIGRKFFPTNIHTPFEKPFIISQFKKKMKMAGFEKLKFRCFNLFSHSIPIIAKYFPIKKLKLLLVVSLFLENILLKSPLKEFSWSFSAIYQKEEFIHNNKNIGGAFNF